MTHLDLCTGIGGFHLAAEWAGFETVGFSEIDPYCCALLKDKWPHIQNYGDLRTADFSSLRGTVTVLSAGVPCQPASLAGKRLGKDDHRWLWPAVLDVVELVKPTWAVFENPPGIVTLGEFGGVLSRLASLGYAVRMFSVSANSVGAKHKRERVFIVANSERIRSQGGESSSRICDGSNGSGERSEPLSEIVGYSENERCERIGATWRRGNGSEDAGEAMADAENEQDCREGSRGLQSEFAQFRGSIGNFRLTEPPLCRATDGIRDRSHRLKGLGNSVVPQQAFPFFKAIAKVEGMK